VNNRFGNVLKPQAVIAHLLHHGMCNFCNALGGGVEIRSHGHEMSLTNRWQVKSFHSLFSCQVIHKIYDKNLKILN
jgi:hypothetical protein